MHFKQLEIFGFKSFADKTVLNFEPGITAIIGPNGCGKSNVFDAIRWVLGEQSVKELRGSSMEDVIFNGTDNKPALGFAEVSLTFSNDSKILDIEYDEVTITRRLFRSGESEYLLNKAPVRLKDITELIMGTGIGAEAYSLVQQGKVDLVVSAKPEDRRVILDEASGITKYKAKKREALNKLKDTEQNLLRINDIITEVKRQIGSIERQAKKAQRYKEEFEKLKSLETMLANYELKNFDEDRKCINALLGQLSSEESSLTEKLTQLSELLTQEGNLLEELEQKVSEVKAEDIKLDGQIDINNRQIGFNEERIENISANEKRIEENKVQLMERCRIQRDKIEEVKCSLEDLGGLMQQNNTLLKEKKENLGQIATSIKSAKETIAQEEEKILEISTKQVSVKNELTEVMKSVQGSLARKRRLDVEKTKVLNEKEEIDRRLENINGKIINAKNHCQNLRNELSQKNHVLKEQVTRIAQLENEINEMEKKKLFLISQKEFIEKLSAQYKDIPDPTVEGRLITSTPPGEHHTGIIGKVKEVLPLFGDKLESLKGNFPQDVNQLYEIICETKFIELDPQQITIKIDEMAYQIDQKILQKDELDTQIKEQRISIKQTELNIQEETKALSIFEAQKKEVSDESDKLHEELELLMMEMEEVTESLNTTKKKEEELTFKLDTLNQELSFSQMKIKEKQEFISTKSLEREGTTVAIAQLETEINSLEDKKHTHHENLKMYTSTMDSSLEEIRRIEEDFIGLEEKKNTFSKDIEELHVKIARLKEQKESLREVLFYHEKQKGTVTERMEKIEQNIVQSKENLDEIKEKFHSGKMNEQEVAFKEKEIKDRLLQTYKIDMDIVLAGTDQDRVIQGEGSEEAGEAVNTNELASEIEKLKKRCDSFGSVNLVAIEEFEELKERFEFLTKQQSDLITAKESLHATIRKINRQTRQMFMDTFTKVSEEFRIYFRMLFGGGEAQLVLLDPENVLESGIEIIARPPGKKLQNISLLSGGEKTLTAIAMIFGVFKVNPSPFCVLDEIDAALDESNVGRFSYLLKDFSKIAQFIVITHNRKTISSSDVMYGITMQETGISKVVSVKFDEKEEKKKAKENLPVGV